MALIKCPECGREISDKASRCVHCGITIQTNKSFTSPTDDSIRKWTKRMQIAGCICGIGVIMTIIGIVLSIGSVNRQQAQRTQPNNTIAADLKSTEAVEYTASSSKKSNSGSSTKKSYSSTSSSSKSLSSSFTNKFGTSTTKCAHPGCTNYIASSGDTNCCTTHSKRCLECGKYIDEDAMYCMDCLTNAANKIKNGY